MSNKVLVSIVSDQTIPNVLFIKESKEIERYLFVTTEKMETKIKVDSIVNGAGISEKNYKKLIVIEDSLSDIDTKLKQCDYFNSDDEFVVNMTGGTKIMSIAVYNFFKERNSQIIYIPMGKNDYKVIFPKKEIPTQNLKYRLNLAEYLTSNGVDFKTGKCSQEEEFTNSFYTQFIEGKIDHQQVNDIRKLRNNRKIKKVLDKKKKVNKEVFSGELYEVFETRGLVDEDTVSKKDIDFIIGGWFEEYVFNKLSAQDELRAEDIAININIIRDRSQNEFDVMFVFKNALYVIECKTGLTGPGGKNLLTDTLYKLDSLKKNFGLFVKAFVVTLDNLRDPNGEIKKHWKNRAALMQITLIDKKDFAEVNFINKIIK